MKKIKITKLYIILFMLFNIFSISRANTLNNLSYNKESVVLSFSDELTEKDYTSNYDSATYLLRINLKNIKINKEVIKNTIAIKDKFIDTIIFDENKDRTSIFIYGTHNMDYEMFLTDKKDIVIIFKEVVDKKYKPTIVIDAGHGGKDSGGLGLDGLREKDIALEFALKLRDSLKDDYNIIMTRNDDYFVTLSDRARIANEANSDLFVSIHLNASKSPLSNGSEVFYFSKNPSAYAREISKFENSFDTDSTLAIEGSQFLLNDIEYHSNQLISAALATDVLDNIVDTVGPIRRRGVFGANFAVLRGTKSPAILIELGFLTNSHDSAIFSDEIMQIIGAEAVANAIRKHF